MTEEIKDDDFVNDTQDTFYENPDPNQESKAIVADSQQSHRESQEFTLFMQLDEFSEDPLNTSNAGQSSSMNEKTTNSSVEEKEVDDAKEHSNVTQFNNENQTNTSLSVEDNDKQETITKNKEKKSVKNDSEEEFVEGTPPPSPISKLNQSFSTAMKRKTEDDDVHSPKVSRKSLSSDALTASSNLEEDADLFVADSPENTSQTVEMDIIPETQESNWTSESINNVSDSKNTEIKHFMGKENENIEKHDDIVQGDDDANTNSVNEIKELKQRPDDNIKNNTTSNNLENQKHETIAVNNDKYLNEQSTDKSTEMNDNNTDNALEGRDIQNLDKSVENQYIKEKKTDHIDNNVDLAQKECNTEKTKNDSKLVNSESENLVEPSISHEIEKVNLTNGMKEDDLKVDKELGEKEMAKQINDTEKMEVDNQSEVQFSKSRHSIEVIYDKKIASQDPKNLPDVIEINDDEKETQNVSNKLSDTDPEIISILQKNNVTTSSDATLTNVQVINIQDSDCEDITANNNSLQKDKSMEDLFINKNQKTTQMEKEIGFFIKLKCLINVDEITKDLLQKEILNVQCEVSNRHNLSTSKPADTSASLADISGNDGNKDGIPSPGSVISNPQQFSLSNRLSIMSSTSSSSSISSAASLAAKISAKDNAHFTFPRYTIPRSSKHKSNDTTALAEHQDSALKDWKNVQMFTTTVLNFATVELTNSLHSNNIAADSVEDFNACSPTANASAIPTSTPESKRGSSNKNTAIVENQSTPRSTRKRKTTVKRARTTKTTKSALRANGYELKISPEVFHDSEMKGSEDLSDETPNGTPSKRAKPMTPSVISKEVVSQNKVDPADTDELIGKQVFAKWSDNNYYPGKVSERVKLKYKVDFYDGQSKILVEDFVIPVLILKEGMSVYASTKEGSYDSSGIILKVRQVKGKPIEQSVLYTIELDDDSEKIVVPITNISLTTDQAQVLRDEVNQNKPKSAPSTPSTNVTLDNMVEGKRRSKRTLIGTPTYGTPLSKKNLALKMANSSDETNKPSVSGLATTKKEDTMSSDYFNDKNTEAKSSSYITGVQAEIDGTSGDFVPKKINGRSKSKGKKKAETPKEDPLMVEALGPIPPIGSNFFAGLSFILTCANVQQIDKYTQDFSESSSDNYGTDNEDNWIKQPFVRERLKAQLIAGGGIVYDDVADVPEEDYTNTKLITNVPNCTAKSILCLSLGIKAINHNWVIRCCRENKRVNMSEEELPTGWSLDKRAYVESYQRNSEKPLTSITVGIAHSKNQPKFSEFWGKVCRNAGANVIVIENEGTNFVEATLILATAQCPSFILKKASEWQTPIVSTVWVVQCLIEGKICSHDTQTNYIHTYERP